MNERMNERMNEWMEGSLIRYHKGLDVLFEVSTSLIIVMCHS